MLKKPVKISDRPKVHLIASTSGTDSDWVVKLIDVYPDQVAAEPQMGRYQLLIGEDIFRARYRTSVSKAEPIADQSGSKGQTRIKGSDSIGLRGSKWIKGSDSIGLGGSKGSKRIKGSDSIGLGAW